MELLDATLETLEMTVFSLVFSYLLGLPLGILTNETDEKGLFPNRYVHSVCNVIIGIGRAIPFPILIVLVLPFTRLLIGTGVGTWATIVPLTIAAFPFVARVIEESVSQVDPWIIRASKIDNASNLKIIFKIKIGSRMSDLTKSVGITSVAIISYTAMSGAVGGGGLGNYALVYGFYRYNWLNVLWATIIIVLIVLVFQWTFKFLSRLFD